MPPEQTHRLVVNVPANWLTYPDGQLYEWMNALDKIPIQAAQDLADEICDEIDLRERKREAGN